MQIKQFLFASAFLLVASLTGTVYAQEERAPGQEMQEGNVVVSTKTATIADVGIYSAAFVGKGNREVTIGFTLRSDLGTQSGVRFGVNAYRKTDTGYRLVDTYVASESLTLPSKEYVYREISYVPPASVSGNLELFIAAKTETNIPLSETPVGSHTFAELSGAPAVNLQGCDVSQIGSSTVRCTVRNTGSNQITAVLYSELRSFGSFGALVSSPFSQAVQLRSRESKTIVLDNIPNILTAGVYAVEAKLIARDNPDILIDRKLFSAQVAGPINKITNIFVNQANDRTFDVGVVSLANIENGMVMVALENGEKTCGDTKVAFSRPRTDAVVSTSFTCSPNKLTVRLVNGNNEEVDKRTIDYIPTFSSKRGIDGDMQTLLYGGIGILGLLIAYALIRRRASTVISGGNTFTQ